MARHGKSQMRRQIGLPTNKCELVVELPNKKIVKIGYVKKDGEKRVDIEKALSKNGMKLLNLFYVD